MKTRKLIVILAVLLACYASGPYLAGMLRAGDRRGPMIYPESFHELLYIIAHESSHNEKPRLALDGWMYDRPLFYGLSRRLKSQQKRQAYIERVRQNNSRMVEDLVKMNQEVDQSN